jgi:C-terminal processing protease CtpA/Prc
MKIFRVQIQTIELNKGWNSRLGFSVGIGADGYLVISAIYDDSVAAKDGRLEVGDRVLRVSPFTAPLQLHKLTLFFIARKQVNGEKLEGSTKEYVIDILRKTRGPVAITVRKAA